MSFDALVHSLISIFRNKKFFRRSGRSHRRYAMDSLLMNLKNKGNLYYFFDEDKRLFNPII